MCRLLLPWHSHCESSLDECRLQNSASWLPIFANQRPVDLPIGSYIAPTSTIAELLSSKADTHFTVPRRVEG